MAISITNVRLFDGESLTSASTVRVDDSTVTAVGGPGVIERGDHLVDGKQGTLLPGLIDAHVHLLPGASAQALGFGVTTMLDMFSKPDLIEAERAEFRRATLADVHSSSVGATAPGGHPSMMYAPFPTISRPEEAGRFVHDRLDEGARYVKLFYEGGQSIDWPMPSLSIGCVKALVNAAHDAGVLVVAHAQKASDAVEMAQSGVDVLAHVPLDAMTARQVDTLASRSVAVVSTLSIADGFPASGQSMPLLDHPGIAQRLGERWCSTIRSQADRWMPPGMPSFLDATENVRHLHHAGVTVLAGTDAPNPGTVHGASLHRELWHLARAGFTPVEALQAATSAPAATFGLEGVGRIRPGCAADLVLVRGRPDVTIESSTAVEMVWKSGQLVDLDSHAGSRMERAGLDYLAAKTQRVVTAVTEKLARTQGRSS